MLLSSRCLATLALLAALPAHAGWSRADYDRLTGRRLGPETALPAEGLSWTLDASSWSLTSGTVRLQESVGGVTTGLWFEGRGRLEVQVPDRVELRQLRRFAADAEIETLSTDFDRMLLRAAEGPPLASFPSVEGGRTLAAYEDRHEHYLEVRRFDVDAQVLAALADPDAGYWQAEVRTPRHGWITVTFDGRRPEELTVDRFDRSHDYLESWLSLDRAEDRRPDGRPVSARRPLFDIRHVDLTGDLTQVPRKDPDTIEGIFSARVDVELLTDGASALPFLLTPLAEVVSVKGPEGEVLDFVRDHIGGRSGAIDDEIYDGSLLVLLGEARDRGSLSLVIDYELRLPKYVSGRAWYPMGRAGFTLRDLHTARLKLTTDGRHALQSMGRRIEETSADDRRTTVWDVAEPTKMVTFTMQKRSYSKTVASEGLPELTTVGDTASRSGGGSGGASFRVLNPRRIDQVADGTVRALDYLQELLGPLPDEHLYAAMIPSPHGQAFAGFLHLGNFTAVLDTPATAERFRAHEVGHQWWGHLVGWHSYRDQWLSEGFAEYVALLFVRETVEGGDKVFAEAIKAYNDEIRGSLTSTFSSFARPGSALLTARGLDRIGPIGHGWRAGTGDAPSAYRTLAYSKGALVLNMARLVCREQTGSDEAFVGALRDFVRDYRGRYPSTDDFRGVLERRTGSDWSWFFDQWVLSNDIPTYAWSWTSAASAEGVALRLTVEQRDVGREFKMVVPVALDFGKGRREERLVWVDAETTVVELALPAKPRKVHFNAGDAVIANVKKR